MAIKAQPWSDPKKVLAERLRNAKDARGEMEARWAIVDSVIYSEGYRSAQNGIASSSTGGTVLKTGFGDDVDNTSSDISIMYAMKNVRFIQSQISTNAPAVSIRPTSSDQEDIHRASAADKLARYGLRQYKFQELFDITGNDTLHYGNGFIKTLWNPEAGEILNCDEEGNLVMQGDFEATVVSPKYLYIDPDATMWSQVRYVFEQKIMPFEQAVHMLMTICDMEQKEAEETLKKYRQQNYNDPAGNDRHDVVVLYEYWETGLPYNGYAGRFCLCAEDGTPVTPVYDSPYKFSSPLNKQTRQEHQEYKIKAGKDKIRVRKARLPYHHLTDIDRTGSVWGLSFLDFVIRPQDVINRLDSVMLDNLEVHAVYRLVVPESCDVADEAIANTPREVIKISGNQPPYFAQPPVMTPDLSRYREMLKQSIDELSGVNEAMFGIQNRETAGTAMQYSVNQGSQIRKRLFNKLAMMTESVYRDYLDIIRENWDVKRHIAVLGKENALESLDIKGADIDGGFDIVVEYGTTLPIDPMTRRQELLNYLPFFKEAGVPMRSLIPLMKLNELDGFYDMVERANKRQREYFAEMTASGVYISPALFEDHENMLVYAKEYIMSQEYKGLEQKQKELIQQHITERTTMPGKEAQLLASMGGQEQPAAAAPAPQAPLPGTPPELAPAGALPPLGQ